MKEKKQHPSYGMISASNVFGTSTLFGTDVKPHGYISIRICKAAEELDLGKSWYYQNEEIIEVNLSYTQFAELITTMNSVGVPCTLHRVNGQLIPKDDSKEYKAVFHRRRMKEMANDLLSSIKNSKTRVSELIKKLSQKDQAEINRTFDRLNQELASNFPFYMEQFYEEMDNVAADIKLNMEQELHARMHALGIQTFKENMISHDRLLGPNNATDL